MSVTLLVDWTDRSKMTPADYAAYLKARTQAAFQGVPAK